MIDTKLTSSTATGRSVAVWDLAPDDGGAPCQFQAWSTRADELIAAFPQRYRLVQSVDTAPTERSDGRPIDEKAGLQ
jgi:hypothetical protein